MMETTKSYLIMGHLACLEWLSSLRIYSSLIRHLELPEFVNWTPRMEHWYHLCPYPTMVVHMDSWCMTVPGSFQVSATPVVTNANLITCSHQLNRKTWKLRILCRVKSFFSEVYNFVRQRAQAGSLLVRSYLFIYFSIYSFTHLWLKERGRNDVTRRARGLMVWGANF